MYYKTSLVVNDSSKILGLDPYYYRVRSCDSNLSSNTPATRYQIQKRIQNTVRVYSSLYTSNLASLSAYAKPTAITHGVCWNQMSDRPVPSVQKATIPTGFFHSINNKHHSVTSSRPGCQTPGGVGCDIKHNSYDRYLNRLKGKGPLRRGPVTKTFALPEIPFNRAFPVYGGKLVKTSIVTGCDCPIESSYISNNIKLYNNPYYQEQKETQITFEIGQCAYVMQEGADIFSKATIITKNEDGTYNVKFENGNIQSNVSINNIKLAYHCDCENQLINGIDEIYEIDETE